jgi:hypothetical protein
MRLSINIAENGFVVDVDDNDCHYYFVAVSIEEVTDIVRSILEDETGRLNLQDLAFQHIPRDGQ